MAGVIAYDVLLPFLGFVGKTFLKTFSTLENIYIFRIVAKYTIYQCQWLI